MVEEIKMAEQGNCGNSCGPVEVPSEDEKAALDVLRKIKHRVREVKARLNEISSDTSNETAKESALLEKELKEMRVEWDAWEKKREEAARVRMVLLGHEDPE